MIIMFLMYGSAIKRIRGPYFNVFWYSHHVIKNEKKNFVRTTSNPFVFPPKQLFILFYLVLSFHGADGLLEPPNFYIWVAGPCLFYAIERTVRVLRGNSDTILLVAIAHPSRVLELQLRKVFFASFFVHIIFF